MNFIEEYKKGQQGKNIGLPTGIKSLDLAIDGIQRKAIYGIAAAPKVGKTTFVDQCFVIEPFLFYLEFREKYPDHPLRINWIYYSFEIDRIKKEFKYAAHFMYRDHGIFSFTRNGRTYQMSPRYLLGRLVDKDTNQLIPVSEEHELLLKQVYRDRIVPLFGEWSPEGLLIKPGVIKFIESRNNPTGLRNELLHYAKENGEFLGETYKTKETLPTGQERTVEKQRVTGYRPRNPELYTIVITDHMRRLNFERGFKMKENIDKWVEYQCELRNWCGFTFVDIIHLNRAIGSVERIKFFKEHLYPTGDDVKDTGNLSEDSDYLITLFDPQDEKYNIEKHFGYILENYPNYRSIHLVESRDTECPQHLGTQMYGNVNVFKEIE